MKTSVSIVIPTYNEEKHIRKLLDSLMKLDYPKNKIEIIIVDDGSTDKTPEIIYKYPVKLVKGPHKGVGVARNIGWKSAKSNTILFLDADQIIDRNFIKEIIKALENKQVVAADCTTLLNNKESLIARLAYLKNLLGVTTYDFPFVKLCRKKILKELNGINPAYGMYDDWELAARIKKRGYKIVRIKNAKLWHNEPESFSELWRQNKWGGKSSVFLLKGYKKYFFTIIRFPSLIVPLPLYLFFLTLQLPFQILGAIGMILFTLVELTRSIKMYKLTKWKEAFLTPIFDYITMNMFFIGMLIGLINIKTKPKA